MKILSISQPWASLVISGDKRYETRGWQTSHRGLLGIHAARRFPTSLRLAAIREPLRGLLREAGFRDWPELPLGVVLGTVELIGCTRVEELPEISEIEATMGDFQPGRWAWEFRNPCAWPRPLPALGRLGVFELELAGV